MSTKATQRFTKFAFDASTVAPQAALEVIPAGWYRCEFTDGGIEPTKDGKGKRLALVATVLDGDYKGRQVFDGLNIENPNAQATEIAQQQLSAICHAINQIKLTDVKQLFKKPLQIKVSVKAADGEYDAANRFKGFKAVEDGDGGASAAGASADVPAWARKPGQQPPAEDTGSAAAEAEAPPEEDRSLYVWDADGEKSIGMLESELRAEVEGGNISRETPAMLVGDTDWSTVADFVPEAEEAPAPPPPPPAPKAPAKPAAPAAPKGPTKPAAPAAPAAKTSAPVPPWKKK